MKYLTSRILISTIVFSSCFTVVDSYKNYAKLKIGRSIYLKTADPYDQIDWGLKYLKNRYSKDFACEALAHMNAKGYS
jgi:hypothetical protein